VSLLLDTFFVNQLHRPGLVSILAWLKFFVGLTFAAILIPTHDGKGAAVAIVLTQVLGTAVYLALYVRMTGTRVRELFFVDGDDLKLLKDQLMALVKLKGQRSDVVGAE
jgi:O-antigen/teichoic acid export membrane protein